MVSSLKEEYTIIVDLGADVIGISANTVASHHSFCKSLGGCPFPLASDLALEVTRTYDAAGDDGGRGVRAIYILDRDYSIIHKIPWYQPGHVGQFLELFNAIGLE